MHELLLGTHRDPDAVDRAQQPLERMTSRIVRAQRTIEASWHGDDSAPPALVVVRDPR